VPWGLNRNAFSSIQGSTAGRRDSGSLFERCVVQCVAAVAAADLRETTCVRLVGFYFSVAAEQKGCCGG
jgi:hypothetical protein